MSEITQMIMAFTQLLIALRTTSLVRSAGVSSMPSRDFCKSCGRPVVE